jgi:hypothetical protein
MQKAQITLASLPAREILRAPITLLLTACVTFITLFIPLILAFQFGDTGRRLVRDGGLGLQWTIGILLAAACACSLIRRERESGVAAMLLTKPVARHWYLLSRFAGISSVILLFSITSTAATMLAHRAAEAFSVDAGFRTDHLAAISGMLCIPLACLMGAWRNWKNNGSFHATAILALPACLIATCLLAGFFTRSGTFTLQYSPQLDFRIGLASLGISLALLVFTALALSLSIFFPPVTTIAVCLIVLFGGLASPALLVHQNFMGNLFALLPNWNWFWLANQLDAAESTSLLPQFAFVLLYGSCWTVALLSIGSVLMDKVEVPS